MLLSAFVYGGMVEIIIDLITTNKLLLYISPNLLEEVFRKLKEVNANKQVVTDITALLEGSITLSPAVTVTASRDPKDNFILELAEESKADYIITRDKDLLELPGKKWKKTKIRKPEDFLPLLRKMDLLKL